jgi:hypothetical protein
MPGSRIVAIFGGADMTGDSAESLRPDAPVLNITGTCVPGGIDVKRKARKQDKGTRKGGRALEQ